MDESLALDGELDRQLEARQDLAAGLDLLHALPLLAVHVCLACGARVIARAERDWAVERAMRATGAAERDTPGRR